MRLGEISGNPILTGKYDFTLFAKASQAKVEIPDYLSLPDLPAGFLGSLGAEDLQLAVQ